VRFHGSKGGRPPTVVIELSQPHTNYHGLSQCGHSASSLRQASVAIHGAFSPLGFLSHS
jgi:hypothetical protein